MLNFKYIITSLLFAIATVGSALGQLTRPYNILDVADNTTINLTGDTGTKVSFKWTSADNNVAGTAIIYTIQLDTAGSDFSNPPIKIGSVCCGKTFKDTFVDIPYRLFAAELNALFQARYKKPFGVGESITLKWIVYANATGSNATYENRQSVTTRTITFTRGQFNSEYVPVSLVTPLDNSSFFVEDNDAVKLKFQWTKAYCPGGCEAPQYQIMFDTLGGDFSQPLYFFTVPKSPFDTIVDIKQEVLAQLMYDDNIPTNTPKTYKWTVSVFGNGQEFFATSPKRISLLRGLMKTEHVPFTTLSPIDNAVHKLENDKSDYVLFSWTKTKTGYPDGASYSVVFDTAKTNPNFANPLFSFKTAVGDSLFVGRYVFLRDSIDKVYGINWRNITLKWTVIADVIGFKFMCNDTNDLLLARGYFVGVNESESNNASINVYPNPAQAQISIKSGDEEGIGFVSIKDISGRDVISQSYIGTTNNEIQLQVGHLGAGVYFIYGQNGQGVPMVPVKFVKQ